MALGDDSQASTSDLMALIDASPTPYHAVRSVAAVLGRRAFVELDEREVWSLAPGDCRLVIRGGGTLVAFRMGTAPPAEAGFVLLGAHTDSPNLRVKPAPDVQSDDYWQLAVEVYGSPLLHTWLDRDLSLAGRVTLRGGHSHLVALNRPVCRIPSLAIHLDPEVNADGLRLNAQTQLRPLLATQTSAERQGLRDVLIAALQQQGLTLSAPGDILSYDLCLHDRQPAALLGTGDNFLAAARLDNLASCHATVAALLRSSPREATQVVVLHDHEEVGSESAHGAESRFLLSVLERLSTARGGSEQQLARAVARSVLVSVDMAHALHPNFTDKHDPEHRPILGRGPVLKLNAGQRYASESPLQALFLEACETAEIKPQLFVSRNDLRCGGTIGPISAARTGIRTLDVGSPMLSMHSCREVCGTSDLEAMIKVLTVMLSTTLPPPPSA